MNVGEWTVYEAMNEWFAKEQRRVDHEWKQWDGTEVDGIAINDRQCDRIQAMRDRLGIDDALMKRFRDMERSRFAELAG